MASPRRYYVRSPDGRMIAGYDNLDTAMYVAREYGEGAHLVDTGARAYHPMVRAVVDGELQYLEFGGWDTGRRGLDGDLIDAIKKGHVAIVHAFLAKGASADARDADGGPALLWAVARGKADIVALLIAEGADVNARDGDGTGALDLALKRNKSEIAEMLRHAGAETGTSGGTQAGTTD